MKTALYPGSFDPITLGHLNVIERASVIFDRVLLCVMDNSSKNTLFTPQERLSLAEKAIEHIPNAEAASCSGLVVDFAKANGCNVIIKGVRGISDFDMEQQMFLVNRNLSPELDTMLLCAEPQYMHLCSSVAREMARYGVDLSGYLPQSIIEDVKTVFKHRRK